MRRNPSEYNPLATPYARPDDTKTAAVAVHLRQMWNARRRRGHRETRDGNSERLDYG
jgi:hypothetical protein